MSSCVGPVIDVQLAANIVHQLRVTVSLNAMQDIFLPSVYDASIVIRPSSSFRDGIVVSNCMVHFRRYLLMMPFHEDYLFGFVYTLPIDYETQTCSLYTSFIRDIVIGFTSLFLLAKAYSNMLMSELSQLCYEGLIRSIALASTDSLS